MKLSDVATALSQTLTIPDKKIGSFTIDSRKVANNDVFVAFEGQQVNGVNYIPAAIQQGASAVIFARKHRSALTSRLKHIAYFEVEDSQESLALIAKYWRQKFTGRIVGITGSSGKTTVKELLASICQTVGPTLATSGNYNNEIGLPLTITKLMAMHQFGILEMGAGKIGDIKYLAELACPNISLVNNIMPAHIEYFKDLKTIAKTKGEIYKALPQDGVAILNKDCEFYEYFCSINSAKDLMTFSMQDSSALVTVKNLRHSSHGQMGSEFELQIGHEQILVRLPLLGAHNVSNALAAATCAHALGISILNIQQGLETYHTTAGRLKTSVLPSGGKVIDDTYNANPGSCLAALKVLAEQGEDTILVMGDMAELGDNARQFHLELGKKASSLGIQKLFAIGQFSKFLQQGFGENAFLFTDKEALSQALSQEIKKDTVVLIKGSRSAKMEDVLHKILPTEEH